MAGYILETAHRKNLQTQLCNAGLWFHNPRFHGVETAPEHFLRDYPNVKRRHLAEALPGDLTGKSVLDIGCNSGFYNLE